jgi:hypothetical protein
LRYPGADGDKEYWSRLGIGAKWLVFFGNWDFLGDGSLDLGEWKGWEKEEVAEKMEPAGGSEPKKG